MARRRGWMGKPPAKSALGIAQRDKAVAKIEQLFQREVAVMAPFHHTLDELISWCFPEHARSILREAWVLADETMLRYYSRSGTFEIGSSKLTLNFQQAKMIVPSQEQFAIDHSVAAPFDNWHSEVAGIARKYNIVEWVLRWLDKHATAGAMRYYFPAVLSLAPQATAVNIETPTRFVTPDNIQIMLPLIREASSTVASALMLGEREPTYQGGMSISLREAMDIPRLGAFDDIVRMVAM